MISTACRIKLTKQKDAIRETEDGIQNLKAVVHKAEDDVHETEIDLSITKSNFHKNGR